jgi:hypothetical protein
VVTERTNHNIMAFCRVAGFPNQSTARVDEPPVNGQAQIGGITPIDGGRP